MTGSEATGSTAPIGVLPVNLGTPDAPDTPAVRRYLREFLSDRRVVDVNPLLWWVIRNAIVLPFRSPRSAALYRRVWTPEGSPLLVYSRRLAAKLAERLGPGFLVELGMRYGKPSIAAALDALAARGARRIVLLPLFPQYSDTTVGSIEARVAELVAARPGPPLALLQVPPFPDHPAYLDALASRVRTADQALPGARLVLSFHGIPRRYVEAKADPYLEQCRATARGLRERLRLDDERAPLVFQSRFGREEWLQPYADVYVPALARRQPRVVVLCPGFTADCLETIDEIGEVLAEAFVAAGGERLLLVPGLNDGDDWAAACAMLVREALERGSPFPAGPPRPGSRRA